MHLLDHAPVIFPAMSNPLRRTLDSLVRRSAAGEVGCQEELVECLKQELLASRDRFRVKSIKGDGSTVLDPQSAALQLSVKLMSEGASAELRAGLTADLARALRDLMGTHDVGASEEGLPSMGPRILLSPMAAGGSRREVSMGELHEALERMDQLKGSSSQLTMLCLVFGLTVDEAARAIQRPTDVVQLEWILSRDWMVRELDLLSRATPS